MTAYVPGITETDLKKVILAIQQLAAGRSNAVGTVTLADGFSTTIVTPKQSGMIAVGSQVVLTPTTASAAAEVATGNFYCPVATAKDTFTIYHSNKAITDRTFAYAILG